MKLQHCSPVVNCEHLDVKGGGRNESPAFAITRITIRKNLQQQNIVCTCKRTGRTVTGPKSKSTTKIT